MSILVRVVQRAFAAYAERERRAYVAAFEAPRAAQETFLARVLAANAGTEYGRAHRFDAVRGAKDYAARVPAVDYEDLLPFIERGAAGESNVLTKEAVLLFEPSGGSSGGSKLIPYTKSLKADFQRAVYPWLADLYGNRPALLGRRAYWSISPALTKRERTAAGIPIGFESDSEYLGFFGALLEKTFAVPSSVARLSELEDFRYVTALYLLAAEDLGLVSVWSPTFLLLLLETIRERYGEFLADLASGTLTGASDAARRLLPGDLPRNPRRSRELARLASDVSAPDFGSRLWPKLALLSCWRDAASSRPAARLAAFFPSAEFQPKGLLSTEAAMSIPWTAANGALPALNSCFLEFVGRDADEHRLVDELEEGGVYEVLITTSGGLYRYRTHDLVRVERLWNKLPVLVFEGRDNAVDLVGEKVSEGQAEALARIVERNGADPSFVMLAPCTAAPTPHYALFVELAGWWTDATVTVPALEGELSRNFHYAYARRLGQLEALRVFLIRRGAVEAYNARCLEDGQKLGDIKPRQLDARSGWESRFEGEWIVG